VFLTADQLTVHKSEHEKIQRTCIQDPAEEGPNTKQNTIIDLFDNQNLKKEIATAKEPAN